MIHSLNNLLVQLGIKWPALAHLYVSQQNSGRSGGDLKQDLASAVCAMRKLKSMNSISDDRLTTENNDWAIQYDCKGKANPPPVSLPMQPPLHNVQCSSNTEHVHSHTATAKLCRMNSRC